MDICDGAKPFPYLKIRDFYSKEELEMIWEELAFLTHPQKLNQPSQTGQRNPSMKKNSGIFLDQVYTERRFSNILKVNRKVFTSDVMKAYSKLHFTYESIFNLNRDTTLISYYEDHSYYKAHADTAVITAVTWFFREPKMFTGGDLTFTDFDETVTLENNTLVMFPSIVKHSVSEIKMMGQVDKFSGLGRYCMSQFMNYS